MERAETDAYPVPSQSFNSFQIMLAPRQNQQLGDGGQSRFMGSLQDNKHEEQGFCFFVAFFFFNIYLRRCKGQQASKRTGPDPLFQHQEQGTQYIIRMAPAGPGELLFMSVRCI